MIRTKEQYRITKIWLTNYEKSLSLLKKYIEVKDTLYRAKVNSLNNQIKFFKKNIKAYDLAFDMESTFTTERSSFQKNRAS